MYWWHKNEQQMYEQKYIYLFFMEQANVWHLKKNKYRIIWWVTNPLLDYLFQL